MIKNSNLPCFNYESSSISFVFPFPPLWPVCSLAFHGCIEEASLSWYSEKSLQTLLLKDMRAGGGRENSVLRDIRTCLSKGKVRNCSVGINAYACGYTGLVPSFSFSPPLTFSHHLLSHSISFSLFDSILLHLKYKLLHWEQDSIPWLQDILLLLLATLKANGQTYGDNTMHIALYLLHT